MSPDRFGLPPLSDSPETKEARAERLARVTQLVQQVFAETVAQLGAKEAKRVWRTLLADTTGKRGRPKKSELLGWDTLLLTLYDRISAKDGPKKAVSILARGLVENKHPQYKRFTRETLEKRIRRLIRQRQTGELTAVPNPQGVFLYKLTPRTTDKK
jgi:hypothetical protein